MDQIEKFIYFVRHGEDEQGISDVFQGSESPLTALGRQQAQFVADRVKTLGAEIILASPMPRAHDTAETIRVVSGLPLETLDVLREYVPPSRLVGTLRDSDDGKTYIREMLVHMDDPRWHYADEDNYHDLHMRAIAFMDYVIQRPEQHIIAVTHAGLMRVIITAMMTEGEPDAELTRKFMRFFKPMNTGITICRYHSAAVRRNKWRLIAWNDHAHLAETDREEPV
ncbi:MAG: histidine phosphatase family protein [Candidatus Pacebacteria bacterium]|nr:histidine phosphatase family protein [Candidatus Paceibacterota bacterium]